MAHSVHHWIGSLDELLLAHHRLLHLPGLHLLLTWSHHLGLEHVDVIGIVHIVQQVIHLSLADTLSFEEVLSGEQIDTHVVSSLEELLLLVDKVGWDWLNVLCRAQRQLILNSLSFGLGARVRIDVVLAHPVEELAWHFIESLLGEQVWISLEFIEWNELDDIGCHVFAVYLGVKSLIISIKGLHRLEISIAHTNDNNGHRKLRTSDNLINCLVHVADDTVGDDDEEVELLVHLINSDRANVVAALVDNVSEVGGAVEFAVVKGALVTIDNCRDAIDSRVEDVAVEGEAVRSSVAVRRHSATETIQVDHLVLVVELEDVAD